MESLKIPDAKIKKPENVIGFLREFNFGNKSESAQRAVESFLAYMKVRGNEMLLLNEPNWADLIADELEKAGLVEPGVLSHKKWTNATQKAVLSAWLAFKKRALDSEWNTEVSKDHPDWRGANS